MYLILDIKMIKFSVAVADVICHAIVLTRKVVSVNSDGIRWLILYLSCRVLLSNSIVKVYFYLIV